MNMAELWKRTAAALSGRTSDKEQPNGKGKKQMEERDEMKIAVEKQMVPSPEDIAEAMAGPSPEKDGEEDETPVGSTASEESVPEANGVEVTGTAAGSGEENSPHGNAPDAVKCELALEELSTRLNALEAGIGARLEEMTTGIRDALNGPYGKMAEAVRRYAEVTDNMDGELKAFRKGLVRKLEQELFQEWFDLYDAICSTAKEVKGAPEKAAESLEGFRVWIEGVLENRKCIKKEAMSGERFDGRKHRVWGTRIPTGDASLDGLVAETAKPGFDDEHEMYDSLSERAMHLRPIHVRLYKYDPAMTAMPSPLNGEGKESGECLAE